MVTIETDRICLIEYEDAFYSYIDISKENTPLPKSILVIGRVRRISDDLVDVGFEWQDAASGPIYAGGCVIPQKAIKKVTEII